MLISDELISRIQDDPIQGVVEICEIAFDIDSPEHEYEVLLECYTAILSVQEEFALEYATNTAELNGDEDKDAPDMRRYIGSTLELYKRKSNTNKYGYLKNQFTSRLGKGFMYVFSQGDLDRIQVLIDELRKQIEKSTSLEPGHKQRLMQRLERLQSEMHKKMSNFDRFWGLLGDTGIIMGKLGTDAKPFVDPMREIGDIVWRTQARAEELPSSVERPQLESEDAG